MKFKEECKKLNNLLFYILSLFYCTSYVLLAITGVYLGEWFLSIFMYVIPFSFSFAMLVTTTKDFKKRGKK